MIERLYRVLLRLLPRDFRDRFGPEMLDTARALDADPRRAPWRTVRAISDALVTPMSLRADLQDERWPGARRSRRMPMESLTRDVRLAWRALRREPAFTAFVCLTLALGIGANAAMFGIADRLLLRGPDHVRDAGQVVRLYATEQPAGMRPGTTDTFGYVTYDILRRGSRTFADVATCTINPSIQGEGEHARPIQLGYASANLFDLLGVRPVRGRVFSPDEAGPGGAARVAVLGHGAWQRWFGGRDDVLGHTVRLGYDTFEVIGVLPSGFTGPQFGPVDVWVPGPLLGARVTKDFTTSWNAQWLQIVGRLRPGVTFEEAGRDATEVRRRGYTGTDEATANAVLTVASLRAGDTGTETTEIRILRWLTGVSALVLVIACANVANLMLARGLKRGREVAIRAALGAGRARIVRLLLVESLLLSLAGAAAGLAIAHIIGSAARSALFSGIEWTASPVNARVLGASIVMAVVTSLVIGVLPALRATRTSLPAALASDARAGGSRRSRLRTALTVAQAAVTVVLLVGAGLFVRSLWQIRTLDLGFDPERVLVVGVSRAGLSQFPDGPARDAERQRRRIFDRDALPRLRAIPGVEAAAVAVGTPFGNRFTVRLRVPGRETAPMLTTGGASVSAVTPEYFETMGTAIRRGRGVTAADRAGTELVAIVSDTMARTIWPDRTPIGECLLVGAEPKGCTRVVGVAEDVRRSQLREDPVMHYYIPAGQESGFGGSAVLVRAGDPAAVTDDVRRVLTGLDASITYVDAETMQARIDPQARPWTLGATVFLLSGLLALVVAAIGIYSVMSYLVADRRREIGVRLALGARGADIVRLVLRGSVLMAALGVLIGEAAALALSRIAEPLLFATSPRDPMVFTAVAAVIVTIALAAALVPARRARRVNAVEVLRAE
jgi:predicted permease